MHSDSLRSSAVCASSQTSGPARGVPGLMMFANVLLILCAYYLVKPLREGWLAVSTVEGLTAMELRPTRASRKPCSWLVWSPCTAGL